MHTQISCWYIVHGNYVIDDCRSNCHEMGMLCSLVCNFARLNWRWLSKARDSYGFMSCVAQMLILCRYTQCMDFTGDFYAACSGLFVHDGSAPRSWL